MKPDKGPGMMVAIGMEPKGGDAHQANEDCVPLSSLQLPDETEQMQAPEEGDKVQYTVEGTISRIDGDDAYVTREAINGQPVAQKAEDQNQPQNPAEPAGDNDEGYGDLEDMANRTQLA